MTSQEALTTKRGLPAGTVVCCERSGDWAVAWRQTAARESLSLPLVETRSLVEAAESLAGQPTVFLVVELQVGNLERVVDLLRTLDRRYPQARAAVVAPRSLRASGGLMRELGVVDFVTSPRQLGPLVQAARRHAELLAGEGVAEDTDQTTTERIWAKLPWND
ncbi:MAG: hypothetical protein K8R36_02455 [Planctomycetales bacterium]|nr:hypothetical protein [Planctomycetales bacterium]